MQIIDPDLLLAMKLRGQCDWCKKRCRVEAHHLFTRGMGGGGRLDVKINLASLCRSCHDDVHAGRITRADMLAVVAAREHCTQDDIKRQIAALRRQAK